MLGLWSFFFCVNNFLSPVTQGLCFSYVTRRFQLQARPTELENMTRGREDDAAVAADARRNSQLV